MYVSCGPRESAVASGSDDRISRSRRNGRSRRLFSFSFSSIKKNSGSHNSISVSTTHYFISKPFNGYVLLTVLRLYSIGIQPEGFTPPPGGGAYKDPKGGARANWLSNIFNLSVHKIAISLSDAGNRRVLQRNRMWCTHTQICNISAQTDRFLG
jgi:hypothetical protein